MTSWWGRVAILGLTIALGVGRAAADGGADIGQVYLVQNSGWMEPFYADHGSQFRAVVTALIGATRLEGVPTTVASFNQNGQIPGQASPETVFSGAYDRAAVARAVDGIVPPRRPDGKYADSDFYGALNGAVTGLLGGRQGIVWMVTNNKASPDNSQEVLANTRRFYDDLRKAPFFTRLIAFPIRMPVKGPHYDERGFIIYGIAYGARAARALDFLTADGQPVRKVFTAPPVRLKPLDQNPLRLQLTAQTQNGMNVSLEEGVLVVRHVPAVGGALSLLGNLVNAYYPQEVVSAKLTATADGGFPFAVALSRGEVSHLGPGAALKDIRIALNFPAVGRPNLFSDHAEVDGALLINLTDAKLSLSPAFVERMKDVFGIDLLMRDQDRLQINGLPNVFFDYQRVSGATTTVPIHLVYDYSPWPALLAMIGGGLALLFVVGGGFLVLTPRRYTVRLEGGNVPVRLRPFETRTVQNAMGVRARVRGALFGAPAVATLDGLAGAKPEIVNKR